MLGAGAFQLVTLKPLDITGAGQVYVALGVRGRIIEYTVVQTVAATVGDATLLAKIAGTAVTDGDGVVAFATGALGFVQKVTPTALNEFGVTDNIEIETDGGATAGEVVITLKIGAHKDND